MKSLNLSSPRLYRAPVLLAVAVIGLLARDTVAGTAELFQARNGTPTVTKDPVEWVKGNASEANSHYVEGFSIPYRVVLSDAAPGAHYLVLEWDTRHGGRHAIDYLTHYNRLQPHNQFGNHAAAEAINPLDGLAGPFSAPSTFPIPSPSTNGASITGQPAASFNALPVAERSITIWNATITNVAYVQELGLMNDSAATSLRVDFIAAGGTVVVAFGGHIASKADWGTGKSAASIDGSPYHMRMISFDGGGGNQDRSVRALAVASPPTCVITGPEAVCEATTNRYSLITDAGQGATFSWSLTNNTAGATIAGPSDQPTLIVISGSEGSFDLLAVVSANGLRNTCLRTIGVNAATVTTPLSDQAVCPGATVTFATTPSGTGPFAFIWRKGDTIIAEATNAVLTLHAVSPPDAGTYCVEVSGVCSTATECAVLSIAPRPVLTCPPNIAVQCFGSIPPPAPESVIVPDGAGAVEVTYAGEVAVTNGTEILISRSYQTLGPCGDTNMCHQTITVVDTMAPTIVCPASIALACHGAAGAAVSFIASATDNCDENPQITCQPPSSAVFPIGFTTVTCIALDASGNQSQCSFNVTVQDEESPQLVCPTSFAVIETVDGSGSALINYTTTATDNCDMAPIIVCQPPSGSTVTAGTHVVTCTATDASRNQAGCTFTIQVVPRIILASSTADSGPGTLRQALLDANAAPGSNVIQFAFPGAPPYTIQLLSSLPPLSDAVMLDGWSQLQFTGVPLIEVNGTNIVIPGISGSPASVGLTITSGGSVVRGLTLNGFETGIRVEGAGGNVIQGNLIGTDVTGAVPLPNIRDGIVIASPANLVGGESPSARNLISGNGGSGIVIAGSNATANLVRGNYIGTANGGASPLGNLLNGVRLVAAAGGNIIGGGQPGQGNVIAFNGGAGVLLNVDAGSGNLILGNSIYSNGGLGIDLGDDGATTNDLGDPDDGPNGLQNAPVLSLARSLDGSTTVHGTAAGSPHTTLMLEFFLNSAPDGSTSASTLLGTKTVMTDASGEQSFFANFPIAATALQSVSATATDAANNTSEFSLDIPIQTPPVILTQPAGTQVEVGSSATFCVTAIGSQPLLYQWRLNGANVPGATNPCLTIPNVQLANGGSYTVVIANHLGVVVSEPARLTLVFGDGVVGDNFVDRVPLINVNGIKSGNNSIATVELGEPLHGGKPGGRSVWYTWTPPGTGIATFSTEGSSFDTLLAVYTGSNVVSLLPEARDEDSGGFYTSRHSFNVFDGTTYHIAVDGFGGAAGDFVISWTFEPTHDLLPVITNQPISQTVASGSTVAFSVGAVGTCREIDHDCRHVGGGSGNLPKRPDPRRVLSYQWFFNGDAIPGATNATLTISNVQENVLGWYYAEVTDDGRTVRGETASLQINETGSFVQNVQARDKLLDALMAPPLKLGAIFAPVSPPPGPTEDTLQFASASSTVVRGYTGTQVFNTAGSSTESGEGSICGRVGGASQWIVYVAQESGTAFFNTDGSSYNTVMAGYTRIPASTALQYVGCDDNGGLDGRDSAMTIPVIAGRTNLIVVDGVNGATGTLRLNYSLVTPTLLTPMGTTAEGDARIRVSGRPDVTFTVQRSTNFQTWSSIIFTNALTGIFDHIDAGSGALPIKVYRALLQP